MFYSHTFLARKGPLGTVWCAAHLQHRLKKSHYTSTNIPSTVERIMYPEVPIALRMSGHLLLGVVRIYSKQVDYLYEDCKVVSSTINRVKASVSVNLPDGATQATVHSVTLPERFELDALELDDYYKDWAEDAHTKSQEDISLTEQIPTGTDPYIVITLEEKKIRDSSHIEHGSGSGTMPMEKDVILPPAELENTPGRDYSSPNRQLGARERISVYSSPQNPPSIEIIRDARNTFDFNNSPVLPDRAEPDKFLEEQIIRDRETPSPIKEVSLPDAESSSPPINVEHSTGNFDSSIQFSHQSPELDIRASPVVEQPQPVVAQPNIRRRKRKNQLYDQATVLSNRHMKKALEDTMDIRRKKRERPISSLGLWRQSKRLRKDDAFLEPFVTRLCTDLQDTYKKDFIYSEPHLVARDNTNEDPNAAEQVPSSANNDDMDIEVLRNNYKHAAPDRYGPSFSTVMPSPSGQSCFTPEISKFGFRSERVETTEEADRILPTGDYIDASNGAFGSEIRTPDSFHGMGFDDEHTELSDIPQMPNSPGELRFLDQDDNSPAGCEGTPDINIVSKDQGTPELRALSSRTRAVAQYLKRQSSATPTSQNSNKSSEDLSLSKILEGKSRKISARMFAETLVLKNFGLLDINQDKPYDDITLKVTLKLSKGEFSG